MFNEMCQMHTRRHVRKWSLHYVRLFVATMCQMNASHVRSENGLNILQLQVGISSQIALTFKLAFHFAIWPHLPPCRKSNYNLSIFLGHMQSLSCNTSAPYPVLDTSLTMSSIRPTCYSFYRSCFILHSPCNLHPSVNLHTSTFPSLPLCPTAQQFRPWWDRLTFGLTPSLSDSLILPSLRSIPKTFQPTQPQHQNHT